MIRRGRRQTGFTLVELMVALVIGLVLIAGAIYAFSSHKQTYRMSDAVARIQEDGRFLLNTLARDLRMAGHIGCARPGAWDNAVVSITASGVDDVDFPGMAVEGEDGADADSDPDTLHIRYAGGDATELANDMNSVTDDIVLNDDAGLEDGDIAVIADCTNADVFTVTGVSANGATLSHAANDSDGNAANTSAGLSKRYRAEQTEVMRFVNRSYTIATDGENAFGDTISVLNRNGETLIDGVEFMSVEYGECVSGNSRRYRNWSDGPADPARVTTVRIGFLLQSEDRVRETDDENSYSVAGVTVDAPGNGATPPTHAGDQRLRKVFSTTVTLRNRTQDDCDA